MVKPTITQILGTGSIKLASGAPAPSAGLFIPDSALVAAGLSTPSSASAEAHLVSILMIAKDYLTSANFDSNIDQRLYVESSSAFFTGRGTNNDRYRVDPITFNLAQPDTLSTIDPDNY